MHFSKDWGRVYACERDRNVGDIVAAALILKTCNIQYILNKVIYLFFRTKLLFGRIFHMYSIKQLISFSIYFWLSFFPYFSFLPSFCFLLSYQSSLLHYDCIFSLCSCLSFSLHYHCIFSLGSCLPFSSFFIYLFIFLRNDFNQYLVI